MQFTVTTGVRQIMGAGDGTCTLLIRNNSGFNFYLCNTPTDNPEIDGYGIDPGQSLPPFDWTGQLYIGTDQNQTSGQSAALVVLKSQKEKVNC